MDGQEVGMGPRKRLLDGQTGGKEAANGCEVDLCSVFDRDLVQKKKKKSRKRQDRRKMADMKTSGPPRYDEEFRH